MGITTILPAISYTDAITDRRGLGMEGCMSSMKGNGPIILSKGLKRLKEEHPPLLAMLEELLHITNKMEETPDRALFEKLTEHVRNFCSKLDPHSKREEGVLFRMMEQYLGKGTGPIAVMEYEHDQAKSCIKAFLRAAEGIEHLTEKEMAEHSGLIKKAYYTLTQHFSKEENVLFPMAENLLTEDEKDELYIEIQQI
ncbi:hemerythrin domain-containing protein [Cytobacillus firmus]|uniref:hemerythrin domain-containing protein n=2 Tax=Cytobacillus firmus TaxID=1399 RepID=UPI000A7BF83A|nr:hemerythrin domain-containing protein [Cytobacillus firmus]MED4448395.1 hemerythrin domain-containing protein [Cytobacillus firmus]MED4769130.1 hemerythrin domain-containing protein [Cytobacillus firmus]SUV03264.1 Hemerythrin HHE cation binding domain-containing protein [Cytobacillus firmus]